LSREGDRMELSEKCAIMTGAERGMGRAAAL
jgi:hypothetical protein